MFSDNKILSNYITDDIQIISDLYDNDPKYAKIRHPRICWVKSSPAGNIIVIEHLDRTRISYSVKPFLERIKMNPNFIKFIPQYV